jgi:hypothetical protein
MSSRVVLLNFYRFEFMLGWVYVFGIGVHGGNMLCRCAGQAA